MRRLAVVVFVAALVCSACGGGKSSAARDRCESTYGVGNCVERHGRFVPLGLPLGSDTTTASSVSPCVLWSDASKAGSAVFYANAGHFPASFTEMTSTKPPALELSNNVTVAQGVLKGDGFTLTISGGGGATAPSFECHFQQ